jgi:ABC-2 type transport system permease protein
MNIFHIAMNEITHTVRNKKSMIMMTLFPIVLIMVLGAALSNAFDKNIEIGTVKVLYSESAENQYKHIFDTFKKAGNGDIKIKFYKTKNADSAMNKIKNYEYACFVNVKNSGIDLYKNSKHIVKSSAAESILKSICNGYKVAGAIQKVNPMYMGTYMAKKMSKDGGTKDYTSISALHSKKAPGSLDYYAVTMITLIVLYGSLNGAWAIKREKMVKTESRLFAAPVKGYEIFLGKLFGCFLITALQILFVVLFSKCVLGAYWGKDMLSVGLIMVGEILMALSVGIGIALAVKDENAMSSIINALIPIMAFLGGSYIPINIDKNSIWNTVLNISPVTWTNKSIFKVIYDGNKDLMAHSLCVNIGISLVFLLIAIVLFKKEEA